MGGREEKKRRDTTDNFSGVVANELGVVNEHELIRREQLIPPLYLEVVQACVKVVESCGAI